MRFAQLCWLLLVDSTVSALRQARFLEIFRDYRFVVGALPRHAIVDSEDNRDSDWPFLGFGLFSRPYGLDHEPAVC